MFGKKYKIIQELEDKRGNSSLSEIEIEEAEHQIRIESNDKNNHSIEREIIIHRNISLNFSENNANTVSYHALKSKASDSKSNKITKIHQENSLNFKHFNCEKASETDNLLPELANLFPIQPTFIISNCNYVINNFDTENEDKTKTKRINIKEQAENDFNRSKYRYRQKQIQLKNSKNLKEISNLNRETIRSKIFNVNDLREFEKFLNHDLFSVKKITPTSKFLKLNKTQIQTDQTEIIKTSNSKENKIDSLKNSTNHNDISFLFNDISVKSCLKKLISETASIRKLYSSDLKTFNEAMAGHIKNRKTKLITNKLFFFQKDKIIQDVQVQEKKKDNNKLLIINVMNFMLNRTNRTDEKMRINILKENPINMLFSKYDYTKKRSFRNNVGIDDLILSNLEENENNFSIICNPSYVQKNFELIEENEKLKETYLTLNKGIEKTEERIKNTIESFNSGLNKFLNLEEQKKKLNQYVHAIRGNLRVYCRVKPKPKNGKSIFNFPELEFQNGVNGNPKLGEQFKEENFAQSLEIINLKTKETQNFNFDRIFSEHDTQDVIFCEVKPFIQSALDGENVCIFAYGSTGSGKTFTMQGGDEDNMMKGNRLEINPKSGLLPRSAEFIFDEISRMKNVKCSFNLYFSAMEIYNENVYDLLFKNSAKTENGNPKVKINGEKNENKVNKQGLNKNEAITFNMKYTLNKNIANNKPNNNKENTNNCLNIYCLNNEFVIKNLTWLQVEKKEDILRLANEATQNRRSDSTQFNSVSSRSHAIFQIKIEFSSMPSDGTNVNIDKNAKENSYSIINIVDLAGSERSSLNLANHKTKEEIENAKRIQNEANFINKSLTTLGRIITMINDKKSNQVSIPYRESKLTMLLSNSLKADSKTVMIVAVCSDENNYNMSRESLKFASNAMISV